MEVNPLAASTEEMSLELANGCVWFGQHVARCFYHMGPGGNMVHGRDELNKREHKTNTGFTMKTKSTVLSSGQIPVEYLRRSSTG